MNEIIHQLIHWAWAGPEYVCLPHCPPSLSFWNSAHSRRIYTGVRSAATFLAVRLGHYTVFLAGPDIKSLRKRGDLICRLSTCRLRVYSLQQGLQAGFLRDYVELSLQNKENKERNKEREKQRPRSASAQGISRVCQCEWCNPRILGTPTISFLIQLKGRRPDQWKRKAF